MTYSTLEDYKKAIKKKYDTEKEGVNAHFFLQLSRAKLRDLCIELFKENPNHHDLNCFRIFMGFEFDKNGANKVKALTDKFRPLETFLKGETDLTDLTAVNMVAILVDFKPRPYLKFAKMESGENNLQHHLPVLNFDSPDTFINSATGDGALKIQKKEKTKKYVFLRNMYAFLIPAILILISVFGYQKWNEKECMQWNEDHYEVVDCKTEQAAFFQLNDKIPTNDILLRLRKINVSDTTVFFKNQKPQIWYCKKGKQIEYFNGPGFHPENGKVLKPITPYMINKYVVKK